LAPNLSGAPRGQGAAAWRSAMAWHCRAALVATALLPPLGLAAAGAGGDDALSLVQLGSLDASQPQRGLPLFPAARGGGSADLARDVGRFLEVQLRGLTRAPAAGGATAVPKLLEALGLFRSAEDDARPQADEGCTEADQDGISAAIIQVSNNVTLPEIDACRRERLYSGDLNNVRSCMEQYFNIAPRCSNCYLNFLRKTRGTNLLHPPACLGQCAPVAAWCNGEAVTPGCWAAQAECVACHRPHFLRTVKCFGVLYETEYAQGFDSAVRAIASGTIQHPGAFEDIMIDAMSSTGPGPAAASG